MAFFIESDFNWVWRSPDNFSPGKYVILLQNAHFKVNLDELTKHFIRT